MDTNAVKLNTLRLYRIARATLPPIAALTVVRNRLANSHLEYDADGLQAQAAFAQEGWEYARDLYQIAALRCDFDGLIGNYWRTGMTDPHGGFFVMVGQGPNGERSTISCRTLACAIKHGLATLSRWDGGTFSVRDKWGRVHVQGATPISTLASLQAQADQVR